MHICDSSRHNEMSKPVFWLHNLELRYIILSLHTFDWGQTMHFSWVFLLSLASVIDFSCFIDLQVVYWGDPVIGFRCWFSDWSEEENHYSAVFIFQLKTAINRFKVFFFDGKWQIFISVQYWFQYLQENDFLNFYVLNMFKSLEMELCIYIYNIVKLPGSCLNIIEFWNLYLVYYFYTVKS